MNKYLFSCLILSIPSQVFASQSFNSNIFYYDNPAEAKNIHVSLAGATDKGAVWMSTNVDMNHRAFFAAAYSNKEIMSKFAGGIVRPLPEAEKYAEGRIKIWTDRFVNGQPHGGLLIINNQSMKPAGHIIAGGGDEPGASEVAYFVTPENQGKHIAMQAVSKIVNDWAPEVYNIGRNASLGLIYTKFQCFGGKPLSRLDATASPSNPASWVVLTKNGFKEAESRVVNPAEYIADFDGKEIDHELLESKVLELFDDGSLSLKAGTRYRIVSQNGDVRTISKHTDYKCMKYHFEYKMQ